MYFVLGLLTAGLVALALYAGGVAPCAPAGQGPRREQPADVARRGPGREGPAPRLLRDVGPPARTAGRRPRKTASYHTACASRYKAEIADADGRDRGREGRRHRRARGAPRRGWRCAQGGRGANRGGPRARSPRATRRWSSAAGAIAGLEAQARRSSASHRGAAARARRPRHRDRQPPRPARRLAGRRGAGRGGPRRGPCGARA